MKREKSTVLILKIDQRKYKNHLNSKINKLDRMWCNQMGKVLCGDGVSDSFNKTSWNEDKISDQIYKSKYIRIIIMIILNL